MTDYINDKRATDELTESTFCLFINLTDDATETVYKIEEMVCIRYVGNYWLDMTKLFFPNLNSFPVGYEMFKFYCLLIVHELFD